MWKEIIFVIVMIAYLVQLNALNRELIFYGFDSSFELLSYNDYIPLKFFGIAIILFVIGCILVHHDFCCLREKCDSFEEMIAMFLAIGVTIILLILLIIFIDNPILRAVFSAGLIILTFASAGK